MPLHSSTKTFSVVSSSSSTSSRRSRPKLLDRQHIWITSLSVILSVGVLIISSLVLHDALRQINGRTELQYALQPQVAIDSYDQIFRDDIFIVLTPALILTAILQMFSNLYLHCLRKIKVQMIGINAVLFIPITVCFVVALVYKLDTVGLRTPDYDGRRIKTYFSYKYDKGQALCGILGIDMIFLLLSLPCLAYS